MPVCSKVVQNFLVSESDIVSFSEQNITEGSAQIFGFDKVIPDSQDTYQRSMRETIHQLAKPSSHQDLSSAHFVLFGPTEYKDSLKKKSTLLSTSGDNYALKAASDIFTI
jgi:hypothetical protein